MCIRRRGDTPSKQPRWPCEGRGDRGRNRQEPVGESRRSAAGSSRDRSFDGWILLEASRTLRAYKVRGAGAVAGVTRIDGCPSVALGPQRRRRHQGAYRSKPRDNASAEAFFLPRQPPPAAGEGRPAGKNECQDKGSRDARARRPILSVDGARLDSKGCKMPE